MRILAAGTEPSQQADRRFALELWRFLVRNRHHFDPLTAEQWAHSPVLFLNSIGFGYCDDVATAFAALARAAGHEARVWTLSGHVVPEIRIDGRWEMYDPDLEVYYLNRYGLPCGVEELCADTSLVTAPYLGNAPDWALEIAALDGRTPTGDVRYSGLLAEIYGSVGDNLVSPWYDEIPYTPPAGPPLQLPAHSTLMLGLLERPWLAAHYGTPLTRQGALRVTVPAGVTSSLCMPLVPVRVTGSGSVRVDGVDLSLGAPGLGERVLDLEHAILTIDVLGSSTDVTVEYLLNDTRFRLASIEQLSVSGVRDGEVSITRSPTPLS
jgi:hypothetical protein